MKTQKYEEKESAGNPPEIKFSTGAISAAVWKNQVVKDGKISEFRSISLQRRYTDKDGTWKSTNSMRVNDLPRAALVLNKAYEHLVMKHQDNQAYAEETVM